MVIYAAFVPQDLWIVLVSQRWHTACLYGAEDSRESDNTVEWVGVLQCRRRRRAKTICFWCAYIVVLGIIVMLHGHGPSWRRVIQGYEVPVSFTACVFVCFQFFPSCRP